MKLTTDQIIGLSQALEVLSTLDLPIKTAHKVNRNKSKLKQAVQDFENTRTMLVKKFGEKENETSFKVKEAALPDFLKEIGEVLTQEEEIDLSSFQVEEFGDVKIKPTTLQALEPLIHE